jgi:TonB-linked SusC/RagA family outer membrane protein
MKIRKTLVAAWLATGAIAAVPVTLQAGETAQSTSSIAKITATGTVVDEEGEPMIGASVTEKGNPSNVVTTDLNGHYAIRVAPGSTLEITYVGYSLTAVKAGEDVHTVMKSASQDLSEVVVVGYGVQKKVNVVGSISTVDSKQLEGRTGGSVSNMINGYLSGVTITQSSGSPGSDQGTIRVRGVGSFGADPSPLILVDGLPGNMNDLTPAEIESISVLKDAASAAIYGSRAANGVILVTTKNGREGKTRVTYNGTVGWSSADDLPKLAHSYEYAEFYNMAVGTESYTPEMIQKYRDGSDPDNYADEMYLEELLGSHPVQTKHELSISGGSSRVSYQLTAAYMRTNGFFKKSYYDRFNGRLNLRANLAKNLTMGVLVNGTFGNRHEPSTPGSMDTGGNGGIVVSALRFPGLVPTYMQDGTVGLGPKLMGTPLAWLDCNSFYNDAIDRYKAQINFEYEIIPGLKAKVIGGYNYTTGRQRNYRADMTLTDGRGTGPSSLSEAWSRTAYKTFQGLLDYNVDLGRHHIGALLGYTWEDENQRTIGGYRNNYPSDDVPYLSAGGVDGQTNSGGGYDWAVQSVIGRLNYNYDERYLLEGTFRYDGSSRFPTDSKYGFFPSVGAGWRIANENFWKENESLSFVNNLKLKASYGILGNNNIGNYPYQSVYALGSNYVFGGVFTQGAAITTYVDPNLKWEKTHTWDIGLETGFFNNRLTFNASYFDRRTKDILYTPSASFSSIFGLAVSQINTGEVTNRGWEFEIGHRNRIGDVNYRVSGNFTIINNKVQTLGMGNVTQNNGMVGNGSNLFIGYPMQMIYGYKTDGVFLSDDEVKDWPDQSAIAKGAGAGDIRYVDIDGDGKVTTADRTFLGSNIPKYTFGLSAGLDWKGFDFSFLLQGVAKVSGMLSTYAGYAFWQEGNIQRWQMEECWNVQKDNRYPGYPRLEAYSNAGSRNTLTSDFWVRNAWFLKVRNIQLGYTLPQNTVKHLGLSGIRAYITLDNPLSFNDYPDGWDPEKRNNGGSYYPTMRSYTFGLTINI